MNPRCQRLVVALLAVFALQVFATTRYVDLNCANPVYPYTGWATAATNVQDAVDASTPGDSILVTNGVYRAGSHVDMGVVTVTNALQIQSINGPDSTVIDGQGSLRCAYLCSGTFLSGFTLTGGTNAQTAGGVLCQSSTAVISNCVVTRNSSGNFAGGVRFGTVRNSIISSNSALGYGGGSQSCILKDCVLTGNYASEGGGDYYGTASNCTFAANQAMWGGGTYGSTLDYCTVSSNNVSIDGGGIYWGSAQHSIIESNSARGYGGGSYQSSLRACAISGNNASSGGGAYLGSIYNCTLTANSAIEGGGVEEGTIRNSIVYYNHAPSGPNYDGVSVQLEYCCTTPLPAGAGNFNSEPLLASASHLSTNSPCRNTGTTNYSSGRDIDGESWLNPPSIGCDEYSSAAATGSVSVAICAAFTNVAPGKALNFVCRISGRLTGSRWDFGDGTAVSNHPFAAHAWTGVGDYPVVLRAYNDTYPAGVTASVTIHVVPQPVHYVSLASTGPLAPYSSWSTAATNIQDAVDAATIPGALVVVNDGEYAVGARAVSSQTNRLVVDKPILLQSLNGPQQTLIRGTGSPYLSGPLIRCAYLGAGAALAGFTLADGASSGNGGGVWCGSEDSLVTDCILSNNACGDSGGAVFWGTVSNCALLNNSAYTGGGAAWASLLDCYASSNRALSGAAAYNCTATRTLFRDNSANNYGGGATAGTLNDCTFDGNSAGYGGGGAYVSTLTGCLLTNNYTSTYGAGVNGGTLVNCVLVGNTAASLGGGAAGGTLNNCTLISNSAGYRGGGAYFSTLNNCIVYSNLAIAGSLNYTNSTLNNCCTTPMPDNGMGNITNPPTFVDQSAGNLRLQSNSPCINSGNNAYVSSSTDFDGRPRVVNGAVDIGAYEFQGAGMGEFIGWLQQYDLPTDGTADYADTDGDGLNSWQEWQAGTDPTDVSSVLKMLAPSITVSGVTVTWQSVSGKTYFIQRSGILSDPSSFSTIQNNIAGQAGTTTCIDTTATGSGPFFYRVGVQ